MATKKKVGDSLGVPQWQELENATHLRKMLRWVALSLRNATMDPRTANSFSLLANVFLKSLESSTFEERLAELEQLVLAKGHSEPPPGTDLQH